jgi:adenylosuccinate synthase
VGTRYKLNGEYLPGSPADADCLEDIEVEYDTLEGWNSCTEKIRDGRDLPQQAKDYIACVTTNARPPLTHLPGVHYHTRVCGGVWTSVDHQICQAA